MIYNKYLYFNVLYLFIIFILSHLFFEVESFTTYGRVGHSSVLVENKLYFFGGLSEINADTLSEVFYLNVSQQFNVSNPPWVDLTKTIPTAKIPFGSAWATVVTGDINKDPTVYLFGGDMMDMDANTIMESNSSVLQVFNLNTSKWSRPVVRGKKPERRGRVKSVIDSTGKIYIFGGADSVNLTTPRFFDEMVILNTVDLTWSLGSAINLPNLRIEYTATLLSNGMIVYIGGIELNLDNNLLTVDIDKISLYNTNSSLWSVMTAKLKDSIENRHAHTAVLTPDGKIIIYGGSRIIGSQITPDLAVLNTNTEPFEWTIPRVSSNIGTVPSLTFHTADLVGNYMIVAFGNITQTNAEPSKFNPNIYVMDIRSYTWVNTFDNSNNNKLTTAKIVIITISVIMGIAILIGLGFLVRKWKEMKKENSTLTTDGTVKKNSLYNQDSVNNSSYNQDVISVNNSPYNIYNQDVLESSNRSSIV